MKTLVVYESMYGNTHQIAAAVASGLDSVSAVTLRKVTEVSPADVAEADLLVVGGPTHAHGLTRPSTRRAAVDAAAKPQSDLVTEPDAVSPGLREWIGGLEAGRTRQAAVVFDTRLSAPAMFTGRASRVLRRKLRRRGFRVACRPESFLVDKKSRLVPGELERARRWGAAVALSVLVDGPRATRTIA